MDVATLGLEELLGDMTSHHHHLLTGPKYLNAKAEGRVSPEWREETKHRQEKEGERERQQQTKIPRPQPCLRLDLTR
ncbi:unnamed protein product, partial [Bubo scandiacus]